MYLCDGLYGHFYDIHCLDDEFHHLDHDIVNHHLNHDSADHGDDYDNADHHLIHDNVIHHDDRNDYGCDDFGCDIGAWSFPAIETTN